MIRRSLVKSCRFTASICRLTTPCSVAADPQYVVSGRTLKMFQLPANHGRADYPVHKSTWLNSSHKSRGTDVFISWHQGLQDFQPDECCLEKCSLLIWPMVSKKKYQNSNRDFPAIVVPGYFNSWKLCKSALWLHTSEVPGFCGHGELRGG